MLEIRRIALSKLVILANEPGHLLEAQWILPSEALAGGSDNGMM